jgi:hypothetical protein
MSDMDYPRAFVSFPRIAGSGNEIAVYGDFLSSKILVVKVICSFRD